MRGRRCRLVRASILCACLLLVGRGCFFRPASDHPGAHFNRGRNAAWLGVDWVHAEVAPSEVAHLAADLQRHGITTVYVFTSYRKPGGYFNPTYDRAGDFIDALKSESPHVEVQAWIGLPLGDVDLAEAATRDAIAAFCAELIAEHGFDGIHLDPEPIRDGDGDLLSLLDDVRAGIGPDPTLSIATRRIWPIFPEIRWPLVGHWAWSAGYYREVAARVDEVAPMIYDSALPHPRLYRQWTRFQVIALSRALRATDARLLIGVPTSEEATFTHHPTAETMESGLQGIVEGLNDDAAFPDVVTGVAIYPYWETDTQEWESYREMWLAGAETK